MLKLSMLVDDECLYCWSPPLYVVNNDVTPRELVTFGELMAIVGWLTYKLMTCVPQEGPSLLCFLVEAKVDTYPWEVHCDDVLLISRYQYET